MGAKSQNIIEKTGFYSTLGFNVLKKVSERAIESYRDLVSVEDAALLGYQLKMGMRHYQSGRYEEAVPYLEKTAAADPSNRDVFYRLGVAYSRIKGEEKNAIRALEMLSKLDEKNEKAWLKLGTLYMETGDFNKADDSLKKVLEMDPENFSAHFRLGLFYDKQEKWEDALKSLKKAIEINPDSSKAHHSLGFVYESLGNRKEAVKSFKRAIWLPGKQGQAYRITGKAVMRTTIDEQGEGVSLNPWWLPSFVALGIADTVSIAPHASKLLTGVQVAGLAGATGLIIVSLDDLRKSETFNQKMDAGSDLLWGVQGLLYLSSSSPVVNRLAQGLGIVGAAAQAAIGYLRIRRGFKERNSSLINLGSLDLSGGLLWLAWDLLGWEQPIFIAVYVLLMIGREAYANRQALFAWGKRNGVSDRDTYEPERLKRSRGYPAPAN